MTLSEYLRQHDLTAASFAERIGVATMTVCRYAKGQRIPRRAIMARIVAATGGAVGPQDFFDQDPEGEAA